MSGPGMPEMIVLDGIAAGLSAKDAEDVVRTWVEWSYVTPNALDWDEVRTAVLRRADGKDWDPRTMRLSVAAGKFVSALMEPLNPVVDRINAALAKAPWTRGRS